MLLLVVVFIVEQGKLEANISSNSLGNSSKRRELSTVKSELEFLTYYNKKNSLNNIISTYHVFRSSVEVANLNGKWLYSFRY